MIFERVKSLCTEKGITVRTLEKELGMGNASIGKWRKSAPVVTSLIPIAQYFGVSLDFLVGREEARSQSA